MGLLSIFACAPGDIAPSGELECAPDAHVEEGACVPADEEDSGGAVATAQLQAINHTDSAWIELWVCDDAGCSSWISGVGSLVDVGESETFELIAAREYAAAVVDGETRCATTPWFTVGADEVWVWDVVEYFGLWEDADSFGCVGS